MVLQLDNVVKDYRYFEKEEGIKGSIKDLFSRKYLYKRAISKLNLTAEENDIIGIVGPNGAGKTTLLKMVSGIIAPTSGTIKTLGFNPYERKREFRRNIGFLMGNKTQAIWDLPAIETFLMNKVLYDIDKNIFKKRIDYLVNLFKMTDKIKIPVRNLSFGERMKIEFISVLIHSPKLVMLDEPSIGLDFEAQNNLRKYIFDYFQDKNNDTIFIITSHNMTDIETLCNRIIILKEGKLLYDGKKKDLGNHTKKIVIKLSQEPTDAIKNELMRRQYNKINFYMYEKNIDFKGFVSDYTFFADELFLTDISFQEENFEKLVSWYLNNENI